jgi:hypothetical protein
VADAPRLEAWDRPENRPQQGIFSSKLAASVEPLAGRKAKKIAGAYGAKGTAKSQQATGNRQQATGKCKDIKGLRVKN